MTVEAYRAVARDGWAREDAPAEPHARPYEIDPRSARAISPPPLEFAALERAGVPPGPLYAALAEAERAGVAPFDALLTSGAIDQDELVATLARALGVDVCGPPDLEGPAIDADRFRAAMLTGHLRTTDRNGAPRLLVAARGPAVARLAAARRGRPRDPRIALVTPRAFADPAVARAGAALAARAAEGPGALHPELTVLGGLPKVGVGWRVFIGATFACLVVSGFALQTVGAALLAAFGLLFVALNALRLTLAAAEPSGGRRSRGLTNVELPVYTVLVALFKEGPVAQALVDALDRIDYPAFGSKRTKLYRSHEGRFNVPGAGGGPTSNVDAGLGLS